MRTNRSSSQPASRRIILLHCPHRSASDFVRSEHEIACLLGCAAAVDFGAVGAAYASIAHHGPDEHAATVDPNAAGHAMAARGRVKKAPAIAAREQNVAATGAKS